MTRQLATAILLLASLSSCAGSASPRQQELNIQGPMLVMEGNRILNWQGTSMQEIDALRAAGAGPQSSQASPGGYTPYGRGAEAMFAGPDGMFLLPFDNTQGGVPLISAEGLWPPVCLKRPGVDESAGGFGYFGWSQYSDNLGFIGGMPYVVYDQQQLVCFDQAGEVLWEYMAGSRVSIRAALDGMHLLVCDQSGSLSCLNSSGQAVWNRKEVQYAHAFGERILLTELSRDLLLCLDWNGNEIWKQKVAYRDQPYVYFVPDLKGDRFLLLRDGVITCHDREGERIWSHHGGGRTMFNMQLAPDGHVFARMSGRDNSNSWFGGRIRDRSGSPWCWLCLDPQGNPVWQSAMVHTNQLAAFPGYDGVLFSSSNSVQGLVVLSPPE